MSRWVSSWLCRPWTSSSSTSTLLPTYAPVSSVSTTSSSLSTSIPSAHTWRDTFDDWRRILQLVIPYDFDDDLIIIARYYTCTEVPRPRTVRIGSLSYVEAEPQPRPRVPFANSWRDLNYGDDDGGGGGGEVELELQCAETAPRQGGPYAGYRASGGARASVGASGSSASARSAGA